MPETFLERIVAATRDELAERKARLPLAEVQARAASAQAPRDFSAALRPLPGGSARLVAEVKRASPSKGLLVEAFDPVAQATAYAHGGAAAISVLTEPHFFLGALEHLSAVRAAVNVPVLRKDFVIDSYQVYEARAAGADALLLICALLDDDTLAGLLALTRNLGMEALVEAHNADETRRAVACGATVIGVNSRDLRTFAVDTDVVRHLRPLVPADRVFIAESGIFDALGAARARAWGADAILVGEALMKSPDPSAKARELATAPGGATASLFAGRSLPFVKICGLNSPELVLHAARCGADAYGLVFAPMAPDHRRVTVAQAADIVRHVKASPESPSIQATGVFVNEEPAKAADIAHTVGLDIIQLSGDETAEMCVEIRERTGLQVVQALRLRGNSEYGCLSLTGIDRIVLSGATLLLDTPVPGSYGGSGETSDWDVAHWMGNRWPVILAGGLTPDNVGAALAAVHPRGVDVSSGVETDRAKDPAKIRAFIHAAKTATGSEAP